MKQLGILSAVGGLLIAPSASAAIVTTLVFSDGLEGTQNSGIDGTASFAIVEDTTTLTLATVAPGALFEITPTGTGIDSAAGDSSLNVDAGEEFTLSFDAAGTLDSIDILSLANGTGGDITITFTSSAAGVSPVSVPLTIANGADDGVVVPVGLAFSSGDVITVSLSNSDVNDDFRLEAVTATVPEPGSLALGLAGGAAMLYRRRK
ncbi:MAG: PEP-CTERM sorting domain-containing protein [Planctomycetota bacterium]